jgi:hypothetical protein
MAEKQPLALRVAMTLLGLNRAGQFLYVTLFILAIPALTFYSVFLPALRFSDADERLFRAARHGDLPGIEQSLGDGGRVTAVSPVDGKTALFRAAILGQAAAVRLLLERGADPAARSLDGHTPLEVVQAARAEEKNPAAAQALDTVADLLRGKAGAQ